MIHNNNNDTLKGQKDSLILAKAIQLFTIILDQLWTDNAEGIESSTFSVPTDFDPNARCVFHTSAPGHSTEDYKELKSKVQDFIDSKVISFTPQGLRINNSPSSGHVGPSDHVAK